MTWACPACQRGVTSERHELATTEPKQRSGTSTNSRTSAVRVTSSDGVADGTVGVDPWVIIAVAVLLVLACLAFFVVRHLLRRPREDKPPPSSYRT